MTASASAAAKLCVSLESPLGWPACGLHAGASLAHGGGLVSWTAELPAACSAGSSRHRTSHAQAADVPRAGARACPAHLVEHRYLYVSGPAVRCWRSYCRRCCCRHSSTTAGAEPSIRGIFPVIVDRVTRMVAPVPPAANPSLPLLAIVEFRTMMLTGVPPVD